VSCYLDRDVTNDVLHVFLFGRWAGFRCDCTGLVVGEPPKSLISDFPTGLLQNQLTSAVQNTRKRNVQEAGHLEVEATLISSLEKWTRYQATLKRDFYRALEKLRDLQAERRKREGANC
jgi:hypothetical protein